jgi:hypothetical protein
MFILNGLSEIPFPSVHTLRKEVVISENHGRASNAKFHPVKMVRFRKSANKKFSRGLSRRKRAYDVFGYWQCDPGELTFVRQHRSVAQA